MNPEQLRLYLVTDFGHCPPDRFEALLPALVRAGVTMVQLRDKTRATRDLVGIALDLQAILVPAGVPLIINDRADVAFAVGAAGVHLGQDDLHPEQARRLLGPRAIIGVSIESASAVEVQAAQEADYLAASPVFSTPTKLDTAPPLGLEGVSAIRALTDQPLVGIGGIDPARAGDVVRAGASGVAVISAILANGAPAAAARRLRGAVNEALT